MDDGYPYNRDRSGRDDRGPVDRAGDEVRSWLGDEEAARRRRMDEQDRWRSAGNRTPEPGTHWGKAGSYSSDREYGDGEYGWRAQRDAPADPGVTRGRHDREFSNSAAQTEYGRQAYGGPYGRERSGAREWSSTEGWRVPGPFVGRGPRGYQRPDDRIREELNDRLTAHGLIDATDVECRVANGEVTLTGYVDSRAAKRAAEDIADDLYGVREVHNQLRVRAHAADATGAGRTSVLGLNEPETDTTDRPAGTPADPGRPRTRA